MIEKLCPDGVVKLRLGDVCTILNGFAFQSKKYIDEGYRVIRISDVQSGYISDKDKVFYPCDLYDEFKRQELFSGDLVMSLTGNPGRVALIGSNDTPCALNQRVACLRVFHEKCLTKYLFYTFNCPKFEEIAYANSNGGGQKNLSTTWLSNYEIPIPPLSIQQEIVRILDSFTSMITNLETELGSRQKQYEHYRNVLLAFDDNSESVEWKSLGEVCIKTSNIKWKLEDESTEYKYIDLSSVTLDTHTIEGASTIDKSNAPSRAQQIVKVNDVLLGTTRPTLKRYCLVPESYDNQICSTGFCVFRPNPKQVSSKWIYYNLAHQRFWDYCEQYQKGASYPSLANSDAFAFEIPFPSLDRQQEIISILDTFELLISNIKLELDARKKQYEFYREQLLTNL